MRLERCGAWPGQLGREPRRARDAVPIELAPLARRGAFVRLLDCRRGCAEAEGAPRDGHAALLLEAGDAVA